MVTMVETAAITNMDNIINNTSTNNDSNHENTDNTGRKNRGTNENIYTRQQLLPLLPLQRSRPRPLLSLIILVLTFFGYQY